MKQITIAILLSLFAVGCTPTSWLPTGETQIKDGQCWQKWKSNNGETMWQNDKVAPKNGACGVG